MEIGVIENEIFGGKMVLCVFLIIFRPVGAT